MEVFVVILMGMGVKTFAYACLILGVAIIKLLLSNFFTSLLSNNIFFLSIVLFLGVFWIVSRNVLSNLVED